MATFCVYQKRLLDLSLKAAINTTTMLGAHTHTRQKMLDQMYAQVECGCGERSYQSIGLAKEHPTAPKANP